MFGSNSKEYLITLFEYTPISLWEQDFSQIKSLFDDLRKQGVNSLDSYLDAHPEFIDECMRRIKVLIEKVISLADDAMYHDKGEHHRRRKDDSQV